jgi:hypothetical protein
VRPRRAAAVAAAVLAGGVLLIAGPTGPATASTADDRSDAWGVVDETGGRLVVDVRPWPAVFEGVLAGESAFVELRPTLLDETATSHTIEIRERSGPGADSAAEVTVADCAGEWLGVPADMVGEEPPVCSAGDDRLVLERRVDALGGFWELEPLDRTEPHHLLIRLRIPPGVEDVRSEFSIGVTVSGEDADVPDGAPGAPGTPGADGGAEGTTTGARPASGALSFTGSTAAGGVILAALLLVGAGASLRFRIGRRP